MKNKIRTTIFKTSLMILSIITLSACNNLHAKKEVANETQPTLDKHLLTQQMNIHDNSNWYLEGCPWYGCTHSKESGFNNI